LEKLDERDRDWTLRFPDVIPFTQEGTFDLWHSIVDPMLIDPTVLEKWFMGKAGTAFPGSPEDGESFYRTDLNIIYRYDGAHSVWIAVDYLEDAFRIKDRLITETKSNGWFIIDFMKNGIQSDAVHMGVDVTYLWYVDISGGGLATVSVFQDSGYPRLKLYTSADLDVHALLRSLCSFKTGGGSEMIFCFPLHLVHNSGDLNDCWLRWGLVNYSEDKFICFYWRDNVLYAETFIDIYTYTRVEITGVSIQTDHIYKIYSTGTSIKFYVDEELKATISSNIPGSTDMFLGIELWNNSELYPREVHLGGLLVSKKPAGWTP
jgi:hypothetical protein